MVDDEFHVCTIIELKLVNAGYEVLTARDGEEAIKIFNEQHPEIMILDILMPKMNGVKVLSRVKEIDKDVEVIMLTAFQGYENECMVGGAFAYVTKPFSPRELLVILEECRQHINLKKEDPLKAERL